MEEQVFGQAGVPMAGQVMAKPDKSCIEQLEGFQKQFQESTGKRDKVQRILSRVNEIEKYLDPSFVDDLSISTDGKIAVILSEETKLREMAAALEQIIELQDILNSEHLKVGADLAARLSALQQSELAQQEQSVEFQREAASLLEAYSTSIGLVNRRLVDWDQRLAQHEAE